MNQNTFEPEMEKNENGHGDNFRIFFDLCPDFLFVLDTDGGIISANRAARERLGYSKMELEGMSVRMLHPETRREEAGKIVADMLKGRRDFCPIPLLTRDGLAVPVETRVVYGRWNGEPCLFGYSRDMTELTYSEEKFRSVFESNALLMAITSLEEGRFLDVNEAFCHTLGYARGDVIGKTGRELDLFNDPSVRERMARKLLQGKPVRNQEVTIHGAGGKTLQGLFSAVILLYGSREVQLLTVMNDISDLKRAEARLLEYQGHLEERVRERTLELEKVQRELLTQAVEVGRIQALDIMLHNIGNALAPILVQVDQLARLNGDRTLEYLEACYRDLSDHHGHLDEYLTHDERGKEVFSYMGGLVDMLRGEKHRQTTESINGVRNAVIHISQILKSQSGPRARKKMKEQVNVSEMIENALEIQHVSLSKRGIQTETRLDPHATIACDQNSMMQVIMNLVKNAYESIEKHGSDASEKKIIFRTLTEGKETALEISDTGTGFSSNEHEDFFKTGVSGKGSSGLGLFYCKSIVEAGGGTISLASDGPGKGATIRLLFSPPPRQENPGQ